MPSPAKLEIVPTDQYVPYGKPLEENQKRYDLAVYYGCSYAINEPNASKYQLKFINPSLKTLNLPAIPKSKTFRTEWIYIGLNSQSGCELNINFRFKADTFKRRNLNQEILLEHDSSESDSSPKQ